MSSPCVGRCQTISFLRDLFESPSVLSGLKDQRQAFDRQLARFAREDAVCCVVSSAPGFGNLMAIAFVKAVDDPARFRSACDVGAYDYDETVGLATKRPIRKLESPRRTGAQNGNYASDHVENQHDV